MHSDAATGANVIDHRSYAVPRLDHDVIGGDRFSRGRVFRHEGAEPERGEVLPSIFFDLTRAWGFDIHDTRYAGIKRADVECTAGLQ